MVKLKDIPSQDGMRTQSVTDFFQSWKQTKTNKNEGKGLENGGTIEFLKKITNDTNDNTKININQTEEATESPKANTETTDEMDEGEDAGADNKMDKIGDEAEDENKNKKQNKNKDNDNQETQFNKRTEKMMSTEDNNEAINNKSGLLQHVNRLHRGKYGKN